MGCDALYESGYISVAEGKVAVCNPQDFPVKVQNYLKGLDGKETPYWNPARKKYFDWHYKEKFLRTGTKDERKWKPVDSNVA
jgi:hypothetical protein